MIHLYVCGGLPLSAHPDDLILGVSTDGLKYRRPCEFKLGDFVCSPQAIGGDHYHLARIHRVDAADQSSEPHLQRRR